MSRQFTRDQTKIATVKILQTLGYNSTNTLPAEILTDLFGNYIQQITKSLNNYANEFGCTQPNLDHLGLTFRDMGVNVSELEEYVKYVNFGPAPNPTPKYPLPKEDHLNFLKPGSKEVVTRPVHIHEHLPPMNPLLDGSENDVESVKIEEPDENKSETSQVFKKPDSMHADFKRPSYRKEEEGSRPTREISSVMMTTSGFLSPAREGKLPESRTPIPQVDPAPPPSPTPEPVEPVVATKKPVKVPNKKIEGKKTIRRAAPHSDSSPMTGDEKKKRVSTNQLTPNNIKKMKMQAAQNVINQITQNIYEGAKEASPQANKARQMAKMNRALAAARLKTEKLNTTITPIPSKPQGFPAPSQNDVDNVDKLFTEPDKKKVNILKKISNVKNEKAEAKVKKDEQLGSRESSPDLIIDEPDELASKLSHLPSDVTIEPINPVISAKSPEKIEQNPYFDDDSELGTPSTPKTPEMISHSPPTVKEKRKRKEGRKVKKLQKHQSPHRLDGDALDIDMERPKTPEAQGLPKMPPVEMPVIPIPPHLAPGQFPFFSNFGPSLIPPPMGFGSHLPPYPPTMNLAGPQFGEKPFNNVIPNLNSVLPPNPAAALLQSPKLEAEFKPSVEKMLATSTTANTTVTTHVADSTVSPKIEKKTKEHKKDKKDKVKKRNKKDKVKSKEEKRKLKDEKKDKIKKEKKEKRKEKESKDAESSLRITLRLDKSPSPCPDVIETRKLNIKPIVKKEEDVHSVEERTRETSPGLAKISALVCGPPKPKTINVVPPQPAEEVVKEEPPAAPAPRTGPGPGRPRIHPIKPKPATKPKKRRSSVKKDADGNEVWICPACLRQDDGSPMIGCDGCDAWYHWVCVGIQVPPDDSEDWYCRVCLSKKNDDLQSDKQKKKRKKREKKDV